MTALRLVGRIFGYGVPIALMLMYVVADQIHWPQSLLASSNLAFGFTIMLLSIPLFITGVFDAVIPSKSDLSHDPGHKENQTNH